MSTKVMQLKIVLGTNSETSFTVTLNNNAFVQKWVQELRWCLANCNFEQQEAFAGLMSLDQSVEILTESCITINRYLKNFIEIRENLLDQDQEYFNYLHLKFEQLSGKFGKPTRLFTIANNELKTAIRNLNFFVHRIEQKKKSIPVMYVSFNKDQYRRQPLTDEDYDYFEFSMPAGTLFVHYVELGKEFVDLYKDNLPMDYANFQNLHYYSGEASICFKDYNCFRDQNYIDWLKQHSIDPYNKKLGHGKLVLGKVDNLDDACAKINQYRHIKDIIIEE
jgi:hypothetical protein